MFKRVRIQAGQIGLKYRSGELQDVLQPGVYWIWFLDEVRVYDRTKKPRFEDSRLEVLLKSESLRDELEVVDLSDSQRALVYRDGRLAYVLGSGLFAFWNKPASIEVEVFDTTESVRLAHRNLERILSWPEAKGLIQAVRVDPQEKILVYLDGALSEVFGPGTYAYWLGARTVTWKSIDLRERVLDVSGQEIMTSDKVTLRLNLVATYRVTDPVRAVESVDDAPQAIYRDAQLALRTAIGSRTLDQLLGDKAAVANEVRAATASRATAFGVEVRTVGIRDVILPGDMKTILNQVIEAEKRAEANLIRRREETAAARSQANTARLLADNPVLQRMKELEALQDVLAGTNATFVLGGGDLLRQVQSLVETSKED